VSNQIIVLPKEEAIAELTVRYSVLSKDDIEDLLSDELTIDDKIKLVKFYRDAGIAVSPSFWDGFMTVIKAIESIASLVIPISTAVNSVYAVSQIGKATTI
jgi:glycosyltransferase involved in cell wall biosynthesis